MERLLASRTVSIGTRAGVLKGYVWSTLLYLCKAWTISRTMEDRLAAAQMWFYRRMLRIPWKKRVTNEEVLKRANVARALITTIIRRQTSFLGHVMRKHGLEHRAVTGKIDGKRPRGRRRETFLGWLGRYHLDGRPNTIIRQCVERKIAANVRI